MVYLQAAPGTVLCDDAHVWRVDAAANEAGQVLILNVSHLQKQRVCSPKPSCDLASVGWWVSHFGPWSAVGTVSPTEVGWSVWSVHIYTRQ